MPQVRIRHTKRNTLILPPVKHDGKEVKVVIGSLSDAGNLDLSVPKPEQVLEKSVWEKLKRFKAVQAWLDDGTLVEYKA
jgi:hypothetical protein